MRKVVEYRILWAEHFNKLSEEVNKKIGADWQPFGGVCESKPGYSQAIVKYEKDDE